MAGGKVETNLWTGFIPPQLETHGFVVCSYHFTLSFSRTLRLGLPPHGTTLEDGVIPSTLPTAVSLGCPMLPEVCRCFLSEVLTGFGVQSAVASFALRDLPQALHPKPCVRSLRAGTTAPISGRI